MPSSNRASAIIGRSRKDQDQRDTLLVPWPLAVQGLLTALRPVKHRGDFTHAPTDMVMSWVLVFAGHGLTARPVPGLFLFQTLYTAVVSDLATVFSVPDVLRGCCGWRSSKPSSVFALSASRNVLSPLCIHTL